MIASKMPLKDSEKEDELLDYFRKLTTVALIFMFESTQPTLGDKQQ